MGCSHPEPWLNAGQHPSSDGKEGLPPRHPHPGERDVTTVALVASHHDRAESLAVRKGPRGSSRRGPDKGESRAAARSQHPNLRSPRGSGAWLRAKQKKRSLQPFKEQYNLPLLPCRAAGGDARHSGRVMRSLAAAESRGRCFLNRAGRAPVRGIATRCLHPHPPRAAPGSKEGFSIGEANEADHPLMPLGKTLRSFC